MFNYLFDGNAFERPRLNRRYEKRTDRHIALLWALLTLLFYVLVTRRR